MQEARSVTISSNMTIKRPSGTSETDRKPKLMDNLRKSLRSRHYSLRTEQTYYHWVGRFIFFHKVRHFTEMAEPEINTFLTHLAVKEKVIASTQNQTLSALLFLYRHVIGREVGNLGNVIRARKPTRLPVVKTLEKLIASKIGGNAAYSVMGALVGVYELRHADAHLPSGALAGAMALLKMDNSLPTIFQGYQILHACVSSILEVVEVLHRWDKIGKE